MGNVSILTKFDEGDNVQKWEYLSAELRAIGNVYYSRGWGIRAIDERELPKWRKGETYTSIVAFCGHMDQYRWELISLNYSHEGITALLLFKRPSSGELLGLLENRW